MLSLPPEKALLAGLTARVVHSSSPRSWVKAKPPVLAQPEGISIHPGCFTLFRTHVGLTIWDTKRSSPCFFHLLSLLCRVSSSSASALQPPPLTLPPLPAAVRCLSALPKPLSLSCTQSFTMTSALPATLRSATHYPTSLRTSSTSSTKSTTHTHITFPSPSHLQRNFGAKHCCKQTVATRNQDTAHCSPQILTLQRSSELAQTPATLAEPLQHQCLSASRARAAPVQ